MQKLKTVRNGARAVPAVPRYPGIVSTVDGSDAVVWVESQIAQAACVFPFPPSAAMADAFAAEFSAGKTNLWDEPLQFFVSECPHSAASACEGFALAGGRVTSFTSGQDLVLMKEVLHSISGKRLPVVLHVATRSLTSHARTSHCGHDDLMSVLDTGWGVLVARNAQEAADLALIARRTAESTETPFLCAQDSFFTSHTLETVRLPEPELMRRFAVRPQDRLARVIDPSAPLLSGPVQGPDSYMLGRVAQRHFLNRVQAELESAFEEYADLTGRRHASLHAYAMDDAEYALVGMGSMMETAESTVDYLRRSGIRVGALSVVGLRPFPAMPLARALSRCKGVTICERTDNPLAASNPLALEVKAALADLAGTEPGTQMPKVYSAVCGMGGREVRPGHFAAAANNMLREGRRSFVLGVKHPDALEAAIDPDVRSPGSFTLRSHILGGRGAHVAYEMLATAASELFGLHVQAGARHGAEKKGLPTTYHLTLAPEPVRMHAGTLEAEFVAILDPHAFEQGDPLEGLNEGGVLYFEDNRPAAEIWRLLPAASRQVIARRRIRLCALDAVRLAGEIAGERVEVVPRLRALAVLGVFLRLTRFRQLAGLGESELFEAVGSLFDQKFSDHGSECIRCGVEMVERAYRDAEVLENAPEAGRSDTSDREARLRAFAVQSVNGPLVPSGFNDWIVGAYMMGRQGDLPADLHAARSLVPPGNAGLRTFRNMTPALPVFSAERCTACMECVHHCPDAAIHAAVAEPGIVEQALAKIDAAYRGIVKLQFTAAPRFGGALFGLSIDPDKCKGCGECVDACGSRGALAMQAKETVDLAAYEAGIKVLEALPDTPVDQIDVAGSPADMFLSECASAFNGGAESCIGCGEAAAVRLLLSATAFAHGRDRLAVVAAPGCPSEFSCVYPFNPFQVSWSNAMWQNAAAEAIGVRLKWDQEGKSGLKLWVVGGYTAMFESGLQSLSRLLTSGLDVKVFVLDTEIYSSTGGQTLTDTLIHDPTVGAVPAVRFRLERRKELGQLAMMHPGVYVAQTTPAFTRHYYDAVKTANEFAGPAVVICYTGCAREHGINGGEATRQARRAVESRAFPLFTFNPALGETFGECLSLDGNPSVDADWTGAADGSQFDFVSFARTESRFARHFDSAGAADKYLEFMREDRRMNWRRLRELAGRLH
jgi:pyruvate-ferredoxin/flavodoxin oxidoreductase